MADLPPLIIDIQDRMAWAAYTSHCAMSGIEEPLVPDYQQFKVERMVWDAVARGVIDAAAQFINEIKDKASLYDSYMGGSMRCDFCGREKGEAVATGSTHCNAPFDVQPHQWTGKHRSHQKREDLSARDILQEIKMEGLRNHNTRCRPWWHKVVDFLAKEGKD